jgi:photosystem II stability/assembly factor-like uncharacterized protein
VQAAPDQEGVFYLAMRHGGLYRTTDAGQHWQQLVEGDTSHVTIDLVHPNRIACDTGKGVMLSMDGGKTWKPIGEQLPLRWSPLVLAFAGDRLCVGTQGSGVFWVELNDLH